MSDLRSATDLIVIPTTTAKIPFIRRFARQDHGKMRRSKVKERRRPPGYYEVAGLDLEREMRRLCTLPVLGGPDGPLAQEAPTLAVRRASARPRRNLGFAVPSERRISVTAYPGIRVGDVQEVLLHELIHIAIAREDGSWHGRLFKRTLKAAMREAYGVSAAAGPASIHGAYAEALERQRTRVHPGTAVHPDQLDLEIAA